MPTQGLQNTRPCCLLQLRELPIRPFLAVYTPTLFMKVPGRKFRSIPATRAVKYIAQMMTNCVL
jgi:hypothetical protein